MMDDRLSNPFATKYVSPGQLSFVGLDESTLNGLAKTLINQNENQNGNYQIIGPHGVGKTTLTFELQKRVARLSGTEATVKFVRKTVGPRGAIRSDRSIKIANQMPSKNNFDDDEHSSQGSSPVLGPHKTILILDGVERLSWFQRIALLKSCQRKRIELLLTSHRRIWGVRTLVELKSDFSRFELVFKALTAGYEFQLSTLRLREIFFANNGNMREALMSCYDEFEASRARTVC